MHRCSGAEVILRALVACIGSAGVLVPTGSAGGAFGGVGGMVSRKTVAVQQAPRSGGRFGVDGACYGLHGRFGAEVVCRALRAFVPPCLRFVGPTPTGRAAADVLGRVPRDAHAVGDRDRLSWGDGVRWAFEWLGRGPGAERVLGTLGAGLGAVRCLVEPWVAREAEDP
jgi:hypothetical protein